MHVAAIPRLRAFAIAPLEPAREAAAAAVARMQAGATQNDAAMARTLSSVQVGM